MLELKNIKAVYNDIVLALDDVSLTLEQGSVVVLLGSNGSGKSTTLKSISGVLRIEDGELTEGIVELDSHRIDRLNPEQIASLGIRHVLQGRSIFPQLTTEENLLMGAYLRRDRPGTRKDLEQVYEHFPKLAPLHDRKSGYLSGGEQQMLVIGRALMSHPKIMLLDEPSLGLAPNLIGDLFSILKQIKDAEKTSLLIAEQNAAAALAIADYGYVLQSGRIVASGKAESLESYAKVKRAYLGLDKNGAFLSRHDFRQKITDDDTEA
ncbi:MAG: ABC transporter ATP-binding protein [Dehalococcoidales bacterium]|nr:MAG: ABC transporter ATP-binding protein [Dehalococcoidales bacterium]